MDGSGSNYTALLSPCFSTDSSLNPLIQKDSAGDMARVVTYLLDTTGAHPNIFYSGFKGISPIGTWQFRENQSTVIARFDLGIGNPIDSTTGKLAIYVPSLEVNVASDSTISAVTVHWYDWDLSTHSYVLATDNELLRSSISSASIQITGGPSNKTMMSRILVFQFMENISASRFPPNLF